MHDFVRLNWPKVIYYRGTHTSDFSRKITNAVLFDLQIEIVDAVKYFLENLQIHSSNEMETTKCIRYLRMTNRKFFVWLRTNFIKTKVPNSKNHRHLFCLFVHNLFLRMVDM